MFQNIASQQQNKPVTSLGHKILKLLKIKLLKMQFKIKNSRKEDLQLKLYKKTKYELKAEKYNILKVPRNYLLMYA